VSSNTKIKLFRIENPNIPANPNGVTSHTDLVGLWFTPNLSTAITYLRKSTQTFGNGGRIVDGARLVQAYVDERELDTYHVRTHPIASQMDVEQDNYLVPRDGKIHLEEIALDGIIADLRGKLADPRNVLEAQRRIEEHLSERDAA
jgi:dihydrofolate reductase